MNKASIVKLNSMGQAQANLEAATKELRLAQIAFEKAQQRLTDAEEAHTQATTVFMTEVATVRGASKVVPVVLR